MSNGDQVLALKHWQTTRDLYFGPCTRNVDAARILGETAAGAQASFADQRGIGPLFWSPSDTPAIQGLLARYNQLGAICSGVDRERYTIGLTPPRDDIAIYAPPGITSDEIAIMRYLGVVWVPVLVGAALVVGAIISVKYLNIDAEKLKTKFAKQLVSADAEIAKSGDPALIAAWSDWKKTNKAQLETANQAAPGLIDRLLGKGGIGLGIGVAVGALALALALGRRRSG